MNYNYEQLDLGLVYETQKTITENMINDFAKVTGDKNPIHLDEEFASKTIFKHRIAHGVLLLGIVSEILGMEFPGNGTIYLSQEVKWQKPVYIDENLNFKFKIIEKINTKKILKIRTMVIKTEEIIALDGIATVMFKK